MTKAISAFDLRHNFVASYRLELPFAGIFRAQNRWTTGWSLSGITRFASGFPVTLYNNTDSSLLGTMPNGINNNGVDTPYYIPGNLQINTRSAQRPPGLSIPPCSRLTSVPISASSGNAPRRFFYGPGLENFDMALQKNLPITEGKSLEFRMEGFNVFNHAQFFGASAVNGNISSAGFGQIVNATPPRQVQMAVKFQF